MAADPANLAGAYAIAVDQRDLDALTSLFAPGARIHLPAGLIARGTPASEIGVRDVLATLDRWVRTRHLVMQQHIDVASDGRSARGECYGEAHHVGLRNGSVHDLVLHLRYLDQFVFDDASWRYASRALVIDWSEDRLVRLLDA